MADRYPSPCLSCTVDELSCQGTRCERWLIRYRYRQKQINAYAKRLVEGTVSGSNSAWKYPHPDETQRFLANDPCQDCMCRSWCDGKCRVKDSWEKAKRGEVGA